MVNEKRRCWRIRAKDPDGNDRSAECWERREVGIWYGAWNPDDWREARSRSSTREYLNQVSAQAELWAVPKSFVDTARRFDDISDSDLVLMYHNRRLHFGYLTSPMSWEEDHPLNAAQEVFKYRTLEPDKTFDVNELPDAYRLIPTAGRGNVHQFRGVNRRLVGLLMKCDTTEEVWRQIGAMSDMDWLDMLGPTGWESFCLGYLVITRAFRPSGVMVGRTLPSLDIVGRSALDGRRILASCKKNLSPVEMPKEFLEACSGDGHFFWCAYGGAPSEREGVYVFDRERAMEWLNTPEGQEYIRLWKQR